MSYTLIFITEGDMSGGESPAPVTEGMPTWTFDVPLSASADQWTYARTSISTFWETDIAWIFSGIVQYQKGSGNDINTNPLGSGSNFGTFPFVCDQNVCEVTFGWGQGGGSNQGASIIFEIWVSD